MRSNRRLAWWTLFAVAYAVSLVLTVGFLVAVWEPEDGPRWQQWAFALALAAALGGVSVVAALPLWLRARRAGWYIAAAVVAVLSALAATMLTFGLLFLPSLLLLVLAAANVYAAFRVGGLGRWEAAVGVVALVAVVWFVSGVAAPLMLLALGVAAVILVAVSGRRPRSWVDRP